MFPPQKRLQERKKYSWRWKFMSKFTASCLRLHIATLHFQNPSCLSVFSKRNIGCSLHAKLSQQCQSLQNGSNAEEKKQAFSILQRTFSVNQEILLLLWLHVGFTHIAVSPDWKTPSQHYPKFVLPLLA